MGSCLKIWDDCLDKCEKMESNPSNYGCLAVKSRFLVYVARLSLDEI